MSLSTPVQIAVPFAVSGLKNTIPASSDNVTGHAGYDQGFPPINMVLKAAGGIPPFGRDFNGIFYENSVAIQYLEAGAGFVYNSTFSTAIGGYKPGARVLRTDGRGYWLNTIDANAVDPESAGAAAAGWVPDYTNGITAVTMTNANVTLTPLQYGKPIIVISGLLTANLNLIFPVVTSQWVVFNNTTGAFTITCKTAAGTGSVVTQGGGEFYTGNGTNLLPQLVSTQAANDNSQKPASTYYVDRAVAGGASGQCYLSKSGANLLLSQKNGNQIKVNGQLRAIPNAGITLAATGLATGVYFIYLRDVSGTLTLDASATAHSPSTTAGNEGVEIMTGDNTRSLVGQWAIEAGPVWSASPLCGLSWFNPVEKSAVSSFTTSRVNSNTYPTFGETNSEIRVPHIVWANTLVKAAFNGQASNATTGGSCYAGIAWDGATLPELNASNGQSYSASAMVNVAVSAVKSGLSEGTLHYATQVGSAALGNASFTGGSNTYDRCTLTVTLMG